MTEVWHCSVCDRTFSSMSNYQNHTCNPKTLGGLSDVYQGEERLSKYEGGTGER